MASVSCVYAADIAVRKVTKLFPHEHSYIELIHITEGNGFLKTGENFQAYKKGQLIVYHPGSVHADIATEPGIQFCIGIRGLAVGCFARFLNLQKRMLLKSSICRFAVII